MRRCLQKERAPVSAYLRRQPEERDRQLLRDSLSRLFEGQLLDALQIELAAA
jgi:hypothetical protein